MSITVRIPNFLTESCRGEDTLLLEGNSIRECLHNANQQYPSLIDRLLDENGELRLGLDIFVNRESIYPEGLDKVLKNGDEIMIAVMLSGG